MSRTITAMFDSRSEAEAARMRLTQSNIDADNVKIIDQSSSAGSSGAGAMQGTQHGQGFWASVKEAFMPDDDRYAYEEGIRRGGYLLCAQVDESRADEAIRLLDESNSVDFDQRQQDWKKEGWPGYSGQRSGGFASTQTQPQTGMQTPERSSTIEEQRIPIVEEQLKVGKREVARGGARVRSYIEETPVHEQVTLREERVSVERRPVDQALGSAEVNSGGGDFFGERNIEMTERAEEAVVAKEARVREELVVRKTAEEHVEDVHDSVRRTNVEVDEGLKGSQDRSAFGSFGSGTRETETGRTDFEKTDRNFERTDRNS